MLKVAVITGSLRKDSINRKLAYALDKLNHPKLQFNHIKIDDIPLYNQDLESSFPAPVARLKQDITEAHAVIFITPEYNRSIPGVLKNIIDWGTRPYGQNSWAGKPTAILGTSPSPVGTAAAQSHLRSIMSGLNAVFLGQPEIYLVDKEGLINDTHEITVDSTRDFLQKFLDRFAQSIESHNA